jgi:hypothetical protein
MESSHHRRVPASGTIVINSDGQELYPCRCGQDHTKETL